MGVFGSLLAASGLSEAMAAQSRMAVLTAVLCVLFFVFHAQQNGDGNCCSFRLIPEARDSLRRRSLHICCRFFSPVFMFGMSVRVWGWDREEISADEDLREHPSVLVVGRSWSAA